MNLTGLHLMSLYELLAMQQQEITKLLTENQQLKRQMQVTSTDLELMKPTPETNPNGVHSDGTQP